MKPEWIKYLMQKTTQLQSMEKLGHDVKISRFTQVRYHNASTCRKCLEERTNDGPRENTNNT